MEGPPDRVAGYLRARGLKVATVAHPLDAYRGRRTSTSGFDGTAGRGFGRLGLGPAELVIDALHTALFCIRLRADLVVAATNLDAAAALLARCLTRHPAPVVYYAADYARQRYGRRLLDGVYNAVENLCLRRADLVVSNTHRAETERLRRGLHPSRSVVIPNGASGEPRAIVKRLRRDSFVFVGNVTVEHGLHDLIAAIHPAIARLTIVGDGDDWDRVVGLCQRLGLVVELHRRRSHAWVTRLLTEFEGFGLAPYNRAAEWTYFCSPMKVFEYVAAGIPVVISDVPEVAADIEARGLGVVFGELDGDVITHKIAEFDTSDFAARARQFHAENRTDVLLGRILETA